MQQAVKTNKHSSGDVSGEFTEIAGERYYAIRNVDKMTPFFIVSFPTTTTGSLSPRLGA